MTLIYMLLISFFFSFMLMIINIILSKKIHSNREKNSPFECGYDPIINPRMPFSIHFFLISLVFLIFDIEITLLIPLIMLFMFFNKFMIISCSIFLIILLIGLYIEYSENSIDWKINANTLS